MASALVLVDGCEDRILGRRENSVACIWKGSLCVAVGSARRFDPVHASRSVMISGTRRC
jgi:hypothetical protein